jgi:hypothetical protein
MLTPSPSRLFALNDHVADMHADAKLHLLASRLVHLLASQRLLHRDRAFDGIDGTGKVDNNAVAGCVKDPGLNEPLASSNEFWS